MTLGAFHCFQAVTLLALSLTVSSCSTTKYTLRVPETVVPDTIQAVVSDKQLSTETKLAVVSKIAQVDGQARRKGREEVLSITKQHSTVPSGLLRFGSYLGVAAVCLFLGRSYGRG